MLADDARSGLRLLTLSVLLTAALPAEAAAEWQLAPFIGWTFKADTTLVDLAFGTDDTHWTFGGTTTLIGAGPFGVEGLFHYVPRFFGGGGNGSLVSSSRVMTLMGNAVLATPRGWNEYGLRPFVSGGLGVIDAKSEDLNGVLQVDQTLLAFNVGGGAVGFLTERTGLRFDLRYFRHLKPLAQEGESFGDVRLSYWTATIGVVLKY